MFESANQSITLSSTYSKDEDWRFDVLTLRRDGISGEVIELRLGLE